MKLEEIEICGKSGGGVLLWGLTMSGLTVRGLIGYGGGIDLPCIAD